METIQWISGFGILFSGIVLAIYSQKDTSHIKILKVKISHIAIIIFFTIINVLGVFGLFASSKLIENDMTIASNEKIDSLNVSIDSLNKTFAPLVRFVISYYPDLNTPSAIKKLIQDFDSLQLIIETLATKESIEYKEMAKYSVGGNVSSFINGIPMVRTPINRWSDKFVYRDENENILVKECSDKVIQDCKLVIDKLPYYPFSYYFIAVCYKRNGNPKWIEFANKSKSILVETTKEIHHHNDHDIILRQLKELYH